MKVVSDWPWEPLGKARESSETIRDTNCYFQNLFELRSRYQNTMRVTRMQCEWLRTKPNDSVKFIKVPAENRKQYFRHLAECLHVHCTIIYKTAHGIQIFYLVYGDRYIYGWRFYGRDCSENTTISINNMAGSVTNDRLITCLHYALNLNVKSLWFNEFSTN